jgi:hypothetical protein
MDVEQELEAPLPRRSVRQLGASLRGAFTHLRDGNYHLFLDSDIIKRKFFHAFQLLGNFGHGTNVATVTRLWHLSWEGVLRIRRFSQYVVQGTCIACNRDRRLQYSIYHVDNDVEVRQGIMGVDCYEVKFVPLLKLINICKRIAQQVDINGFDAYANNKMQSCLQEIAEAPMKMKELYRDLKKRRTDDDE